MNCRFDYESGDGRIAIEALQPLDYPCRLHRRSLGPQGFHAGCQKEQPTPANQMVRFGSSWGLGHRWRQFYDL